MLFLTLWQYIHSMRFRLLMGQQTADRQSEDIADNPCRGRFSEKYGSLRPLLDCSSVTDDLPVGTAARQTATYCIYTRPLYLHWDL